MLHELAYQYIGAVIQTYNHFDCYLIPYSDGTAVSSLESITSEDFLQLVEDYFTDSSRINSSYGYETLAEENGVKRFIKRHIDDESANIGLEWFRSQQWKEH